MERPQWDPYDVIVQLDIKCMQQGKQINELLAAQQLQAKTIDNLLKSVNVLQKAHLQLSQLVTEVLAVDK